MDAKVRGGAGHPATHQAVHLDSDGDEIMRDSPLLRGPVTASATDNDDNNNNNNNNNGRGDDAGSASPVLRKPAVVDHDEVMDDLPLLKGKGPRAAPGARVSTDVVISSSFSSVLIPYLEQHGLDPPAILGKDEIRCDLNLLYAAAELREAEEAEKDAVRRPLCGTIRRIRCVATCNREAARADINSRSGIRHTTVIDIAATNDCTDVIDDAVKLGGDVTATAPNGRTALHCASFWNRPGAVDCLVRHGANIEAQDSGGWTPLHAAAVRGSSRSISALLRSGASKSPVEWRGLPPLHLAAEHGHLTAVKALLVAGADVNSRHGEDELSALDSASVGGSREVLEAMVRHGADVHAADSGGVTALFVAAMYDRVRAVDYLVEAGANVAAQDDRGWTALHAASSEGSSKAIEALLRHGADGSKPDNSDRAPLYLAAERDQGSSVMRLLAAGADPGLRVPSLYYQYSAVDVAAANGSVDALKAFIQQGTNINVSDSDNVTALHLAARYNHEAAVKLLVAAGANMEADDFMSWTPVRAAAENKSWAAMVSLLRLGANPNTVDGKGRTVLHFAAEHGYVPAVAPLVDYGASTDLRCQFGDYQYAALDIAAAGGNLRVMKALIKRGADVNGIDGSESTALHAAARCDQNAAIHVLLDAEAEIEAADSLGNSPLHSAALQDCTSAVVALLERDADTSKANNDERTPLHLAAELGHLSVSTALIAAGADMTFRCEDNEPSALDVAATAGKVAVLKKMVESGVEVDGVDSDGRTPLVLAVASNEPGSVEVLAEAGARVDALVENNSWTSLHVAAEYLYPAVVVALLKHGANVNARDVDHHNDTPLHIAARQAGMEDAAEIVEALLKRGADERCLNDLHLTPADVALAQVGSGAGVSVEDIEPVVKLLERAAGDRKWRRRSQLILCYARGRRNLMLHGKIHPALAGASFSSFDAICEGDGGGGKMRRRGQRKGCKLCFRGVAMWMLELQVEGLLRSVVSFL
ncbi:unnamed protein product [Laminaria digitata]